MLTRLLTAFCFALVLSVSAEPLKISVKSEAAILINADTGAILFEKNAHKQFQPASITKIAAALVALKKAEDKLDVLVTPDPDALITVTEESKVRSNYKGPAYWLVSDGKHMGIKKGEKMSLRDLLYGVMVVSANDATNTVAHHVGGSIPQFVDEMNACAKEVGCKNTQFQNPHGLYHPKHLTTAYDMAMITKEAMKNPIFREIVKTVRFTRPKTNMQDAMTLLQTNRLLRPGPYNYPKAIGVKTGHHSKAQQTFVAAAKQPDGRTLIAVMLKCKERAMILKDAINLFEAAFNQPKVKKIYLKAGEQKFQTQIAGANRVLETYTQDNLEMEFYPAEDPQAKCFLYWKDLELPIKKGAVVGELRLMDGRDQVLKLVSLYAKDDVKKTLYQKLKQGVSSVFRPGLAMFLFWGSVLTVGFIAVPRLINR